MLCIVSCRLCHAVDVRVTNVWMRIMAQMDQIYIHVAVTQELAWVESYSAKLHATND